MWREFQRVWAVNTDTPPDDARFFWGRKVDCRSDLGISTGTYYLVQGRARIPARHMIGFGEGLLRCAGYGDQEWSPSRLCDS